MRQIDLHLKGPSSAEDAIVSCMGHVNGGRVESPVLIYWRQILGDELAFTRRMP